MRLLSPKKAKKKIMTLKKMRTKKTNLERKEKKRKRNLSSQ